MCRPKYDLAHAGLATVAPGSQETAGRPGQDEGLTSTVASAVISLMQSKTEACSSGHDCQDAPSAAVYVLTGLDEPARMTRSSSYAKARTWLVPMSSANTAAGFTLVLAVILSLPFLFYTTAHTHGCRYRVYRQLLVSTR